VPKMSVVVPHRLTEDEALARVKGLLGQLKAEHQREISDLRETWTDHRGEFAAKAMGFNVSGSVEVRPGEVRVEGDLPFAALPFKGRIEEMIRQRGERLLA
jgi:hypothetical protein